MDTKWTQRWTLLTSKIWRHMLNKIRNQTLATKSFAQYIIIIIRIVLTDRKGIQVGKFFLLDFFSKNFDRQDRLYQTWASYDLPFLRYNRLDFPLKRLFPLRHFVRVANKKQNFKNWQHVLDFQKIFCGRGIAKQSTGLETKNLTLFNKWKSAFPNLIFCHNTDKNGNTKVENG